ncbi:MAG: hypothetical protein ACRCXC_00570 [Legionella sp.]
MDSKDALTFLKDISLRLREAGIAPDTRKAQKEAHYGQIRDLDTDTYVQYWHTAQFSVVADAEYNK